MVQFINKLREVNELQVKLLRLLAPKISQKL